MFRSIFLPLLALFALAAAALELPTSSLFDSDSAEIDAATPKKCAKGVYLIGIRGSGSDGTKFGKVQPLVNDILKAIPKSIATPVDYPKNSTANNANQTAIKKMTALIKNYAKKCPKNKIVVAGYSEGAAITMNTVCGTDPNFLFRPTNPLPKKYTKNIIGIIVYSDGTRAPNQPYDKGTCKAGGSIPRKNTQACSPYAPVIKSYCDKPDNFCCKGGNNMGAHYKYFKKYDKQVVKYLVSQYKKSQ